MPIKETINYGRQQEPAVNINFTVGMNGDNGPADVMLIQTMFHYLCGEGGPPETYVGLEPADVPEITGKCCDKTKWAIIKFESMNSHRLWQADGKIRPAYYDDKSGGPGESRYMTMTLLHRLATEMQPYHPEPTYIETLVKMMPRLRPWLA